MIRIIHKLKNDIFRRYLIKDKNLIAHIISTMSKRLAQKLSKKYNIPIFPNETDWAGWIKEAKSEKKFDKVLSFFEQNVKEILKKRDPTKALKMDYEGGLLKRKAMELSKKFHIPLPKNEKDYAGFIKSVESEFRFDKVMDQFKQKKHEIIAKRNMKGVVNELKNLKRNRIEIEIPVERTDPPTVSKALIADRLGTINIADYSVSFTATSIVQTLDEHGELESEQADTTPEAPMNKIKKMEKRPAGALTGFLNLYMKKAQKSLTYVKKVNLILIKKVRNPKPLTPNFDGIKMNCVIEIVHKMTQTRKDYPKIKPKLDALNEKYLQTGCAEVAIDEICKAALVNIHIVSILQKTWYHKEIDPHKRTILICSHNGHATYLDQYKDMTDFLEPEKTKKVEYMEDISITEHFLANPSPIKFPIVIKDQIAAYFTSNGELYKNRAIFFDGDDWEKNRDNDKLKNVFTLTSRYYKELKDKYDLQDQYRSKDLYHFVRCADLYTPPWCTDPDYAENGQAIDQDRAYMFYQKSPYYDHYQFPRMPTHFYATSNIADEIKAKLLKVTGFAQVKNVQIPNDRKLTYIRKTHMIQDDAIYSTMRLSWLASLGITFDIVKVAFANDKQKIDFRIHLTDWQSTVGLSSKQEECALMGRLIPNQHRQHTSLVHCKDENEFLQLRFQLKDRVLNVDFDRKIIYYTTETISKFKGAVHIHAYILDYQQIEFATKAMSVPFESILKVKVDCLVLAKPTKETIAKDMHRHSNGKWSVEAILDWMETMAHIPFTELKPFKGWTDVNIRALDEPQRWAGFHEERDIKDCKTAHIDEVDFTHRKYKMIPTLSELPMGNACISPALHRYNEITGSAGCAKTYTATHFNLWDVCMLVPTNALLVKFRDENPTMPCMTFHKAFNMNQKKGDYMPERQTYSNYILDECSMICKGMFNQMLTDKHAKNANLVIIHDKAQLAAVLPDNSRWEDPKARYFTYGKEYKAREWNKIHLTEQKRQNDPRFIEVLEKMRELQDQPGSLPQMIKLLQDRIITEEAAKGLYRMDTKDIVIASTNEEVDRWNKVLLKQAKAGELKLKYTSTAKNYSYVNNERVILQTNQLACQELAFASTVHIVQGVTFTDRLFISLSLLKKGYNFDPHLLYTSVSRVKNVENLYLVAV